MSDVSLKFDLGRVSSYSSTLSFSLEVQQNKSRRLAVYAHPSDGRRSGVLLWLNDADLKKCRACFRKRRVSLPGWRVGTWEHPLRLQIRRQQCNIRLHYQLTIAPAYHLAVSAGRQPGLVTSASVVTAEMRCKPWLLLWKQATSRCSSEYSVVQNSRRRSEGLCLSRSLGHYTGLSGV